MKKVYLTAIIVFGFAGPVKAGDMEVLKGAGFGNLGIDKMTEMKVLPVKNPKLVKENTNIKLVEQAIIDKFTKVSNALRKLRHDATWLDDDINRLERDVIRIVRSGKPDHFFQNDLRRMSYGISLYINDTKTLYSDIQILLNIAVKSEELNKVSKDMELYARTIYNNAQFRIEKAAINLEKVVCSAKPELIGNIAPSTASNITRDVRDYSKKVRDIHYGVQDLERKTKP